MAIYEQIVNQLKNEIVTGELTPGEALPSIRMLAADLSVSVITTKRAYEELEKEGLIRSVAGKGFYVCESNKDYLKENGVDVTWVSVPGYTHEWRFWNLAVEKFLKWIPRTDGYVSAGTRQI